MTKISSQLELTQLRWKFWDHQLPGVVHTCKQYSCSKFFCHPVKYRLNYLHNRKSLTTILRITQKTQWPTCLYSLYFVYFMNRNIMYPICMVNGNNERLLCKGNSMTLILFQKQNLYETNIDPKILFVGFLIIKKIYCYSIAVVCFFSPSLHPTPAKPTSLPHLHPPPLILSMCPSQQFL